MTKNVCGYFLEAPFFSRVSGTKLSHRRTSFTLWTYLHGCEKFTAAVKPECG
jgi:hypothetical protein